MEIEFDPIKDEANIEKHGVSLAAHGFDFDTALISEDDRYDYGEVRLRAVGFVGARLHILIFTARGQALRAISFRKANAREEKEYAEAHI